MFDVGFLELILVFVVALLVIGPERLPATARVAGKYFGKLKTLVNGIRIEVEREIRADELKQKLIRDLEEQGVTNAREQIEESFRRATIPPAQSTEIPSAIADASDEKDTVDVPDRDMGNPQAKTPSHHD